ncbi:DUF6270 domain-containing protein [Isoptericola croceus]|uniref:DUF6270 domain-containing protein n=1 Tax=Isoptericola croceus TaxID=3031406 RepID=UPI0023F924ED|nr:DUF6270 domain-containing protein [Isoptericola croceus]
MSKHRVFIYGSCVSRDTFEHFDPDQFELVQYVARQSAISAYTRPVTMIEPPMLQSPFQQRMVSGDYASNLQTLISEAAAQTDLVLIDLTDERLGAYVLPDGSVVTRSTELIESGAETDLPAGSRHLPFGSDQHFQYWSHGIAAVGQLFRQHMPRAAIALFGIPWAEHSETGALTPASFGVTAAKVNPLLKAYVQVAAKALGAETISPRSARITSGAQHPWGDAPFHYSEPVYLEAVHLITGYEGRTLWNRKQDINTTDTFRTPSTRQNEHPGPAALSISAGTNALSERLRANGPDFFIAGSENSGTTWLANNLAHHPDVFIAKGKGNRYFDQPARLKSASETNQYLAAYEGSEKRARRGDHSPHYFWHAPGGPFGSKRHDAAVSIRNLANPESKVLLVFRDPVSRAISAYWNLFTEGKIDPATGIFRAPEEAGVVDRGFYARHYRHWAKIIGEERLHVWLHDDLMESPAAVLAGASKALGLDTDAIDYGRIEPDPKKDQDRWLDPIMRRNPISTQEIAALLRLYEPHIRFIERLTRRDLPSWRDFEVLISKWNI